MEVYAAETLRAVNTWLEKAGLTDADEKMEPVLTPNGWKKHRKGKYMISKPAIKYLGMIIDTQLHFSGVFIPKGS